MHQPASPGTGEGSIDMAARGRGRCPVCRSVISTNKALCSATCRRTAGQAGVTAADVWQALTQEAAPPRPSFPTPPPLKRLSYRQREVLKLRLGIGDGHEYSRQEVAEIFKKPLEEIARIEQSALQHVGRQLGHVLEARPVEQ